MASSKDHLSLIVCTLLMVGCGQTEVNNNLHEKKSDVYSTDLVFNINGISVLDTFELTKYINVLGHPDSISKGGAQIIEEFGFDDYDLWYGENWIGAGHGYILTASINHAGISFNGIEVGDKQTKIETIFDITAHSDNDTIRVVNKNEDVLTFYLKNQIIRSISFGRQI